MSLVRFYSKPMYNNTFDHFFNRGINKVVGTESVKTNPLVNISEDADGFLIELAAPGLNKEDLKVDVDKNLLTIKAEKTTEDTKSEDKDNKNKSKYTRKEFNFTAFKRSFTLPESVAKDQVTASYEDGILKVSVPKKEEAKPQPAREITVG
ncbi:heat-shock protein Hsp20 [marine bacterium AO1-C]|nr:heat-shock protein Hsp20 [marine bacterium AO1-C]